MSEDAFSAARAIKLETKQSAGEGVNGRKEYKKDGIESHRQTDGTSGGIKQKKISEEAEARERNEWK